jgi:DNA polymerase-1
LSIKILIDADTICYAVSVVNEEETKQTCLDTLYSVATELIADLPSGETKFYLTGDSNFRKDSYDWYKANRKDTPRPTHLTACKRFLEKEFGATWSKNQEADDDIGIEVFSDPSATCIIAHVDKDLDQFPGTHYNFRKKTFYEVTEEQAKKWFIHQLVLGDRSDNISGFDGIIRKEYIKKHQYIKDAIESEPDWIENLRYVRELYDYHGRADLFHDNADCLWLLKEKGKNWKSLEIEI